MKQGTSSCSAALRLRENKGFTTVFSFCIINNNELTFIECLYELVMR